MRMDDLTKYYKEQVEKSRNEIYRYAEFMGGLHSILTFGKKTPSERVKAAIEHMKKFEETK